MTIDKDGRLLKVSQADVRGSVVILSPEIKIIGPRAFDEVYLDKIIWNKQVEVVEAYAFAGSSFIEINVPQTVMEIQDFAFSENGTIQKIVIKNNNCSFSRDAFAYCSYLKSLVWRTETYVIRAFNDGNVWEIYSRIGHDVVNSYMGKPLFSNEPTQYASKRINVIGYGHTLKEAINSVVAQYYAQPELREKWKNITLQTPITVEDFRSLTGICMEGSYRWVEENFKEIKDVKKDKMPLGEVLSRPEFREGVSPNIYQPLMQFVAEMYEERQKEKNNG